MFKWKLVGGLGCCVDDKERVWGCWWVCFKWVVGFRDGFGGVKLRR